MSIITPPSLITSRAAFLLRRAISGTIKSSAEALLATGLAVKHMIDVIGSTLIRLRPMQKDDLPYRDDYIAMVDEARVEARSIGETLQTIAAQDMLVSNINDAVRSEIALQCNTLEQDVATLERTIGYSGVVRTVGIGDVVTAVGVRGETLTELLSTTNNLDLAQSTGVAFFADERIVTLQPYDETNLATETFPYIELIKDRKIVGWPGNTTEIENIRPSGVSGNNSPSANFVGDSDQHNDLTTLFDENPDTWFELERCELPYASITRQEKQKNRDVSNVLSTIRTTKLVDKTVSTWVQPVRQIGFAYVYDEGGTPSDIQQLIAPDKWRASLAVNTGASITEITESKIGAPEDGVLTLNMGFPFATPRTINKIEIDPYISPRSNGLPVIVERVEVTDESQYTHVLVQHPQPITERTIYTLPTLVTAQYVRIILSQPTPYDTLIGHPFYAAKIEEKKKTRFLGLVIGRSEKQYVKRAENPDERTFYNSSSSRSLLGDFAVALSFGGQILKNKTAIAAGAILSTFGTTTTKTILDQETGIDIFSAKRWAIGVRSIGLKQSKYKPIGTLVTKPYTFAETVNAIRINPLDDVPDGTSIRYEVSADKSNWYTVVPGRITGLPFNTNSLTVRLILTRRNDHELDVLLTPSLRGFDLQGFYA